MPARRPGAREPAAPLAWPRTSTSASPRRPVSTSSIVESRRGRRARGGRRARRASPTSIRAAGSPARRCCWPDGTWQPSRRRFPTVRGTIVRRTPLRRIRSPYETQREHYALDERPTEPVQADWMLGAFLLMRRTMLDEIGGWDAGFRHYCEDIDLCYRAMQAGWERWYVPERGRDARLRGGDRPALPLPPHALARARHGPVRPQAPGAAARAVTAKEDQYARQAQDWTERAYADVTAYLEHRAELIVELGPRLGPGDEVLDLACGDGRPRRGAARRGPSLPRRRLDARDGRGGATPARRARRGRRSAISTTTCLRSPVAATTVFRAIYYARDRAAFFRHVSGSRRRSSSSTSTRGSTASTTCSRICVPPASRRSTCARSSCRRRSRCPAPSSPLAKALERSGPLARLALRVRFTYLVAASR